MNAQSINAGVGSLWITHAAPFGVQLSAPEAGIISRWRVMIRDVGENPAVQLRLLSPAGGTTYTAFASGPIEQATPGSVNTFAARMPILAGQVVGLSRPEGGEAMLPFGGAGWTQGAYEGPGLADGASAPLTYTVDTLYVALNADVEPDADGDGFGDDSQDFCGAQPGTDRGCPPGTLDPTVEVIEIIEPAGDLATVDPASVKLSANRRRLSLVVSCLADRVNPCVGKVKAKTAERIALPGRRKRKAVLSLGKAKFAIGPGGSAKLKLKVPKRTRKALAKRKRTKLKIVVSESRTVEAG